MEFNLNTFEKNLNEAVKGILENKKKYPSYTFVLETKENNERVTVIALDRDKKTMFALLCGI